MNTNKEDMRELAAQLYAVVISTMTGNELQTAVQNLVKITKDNHVCCAVSCLSALRALVIYPVLTFVFWVIPQSPETQHGAILALGYMVGRNLSRKKAMEEERSITSQDDDKLVSLATKTIGMFLLLINVFVVNFIKLKLKVFLICNI